MGPGGKMKLCVEDSFSGIVISSPEVEERVMRREEDVVVWRESCI